LQVLGLGLGLECLGLGLGLGLEYKSLKTSLELAYPWNDACSVLQVGMITVT